MKNAILAMLAAATAFAVVPSAQAATTIIPVGSPDFTATPGPNGTFSGSFKRDGIAAGEFTDIFTFTLPANGFGSGTVTTSATIFQSANDLDFISVFINGVAASLNKMDNDLFETAFKNGVPIFAGQLNTLTVNGLSRGGGAYGGQLSFIPGVVPEPATWAMMMVGFGMIGAAVRYRRRSIKFSIA